MRKLGNRLLDIFQTFFGCFLRYMASDRATLHTERSTIVDLLIKISGPGFMVELETGFVAQTQTS